MLRGIFVFELGTDRVPSCPSMLKKGSTDSLLAMPLPYESLQSLCSEWLSSIVCILSGCSKNITFGRITLERGLRYGLERICELRFCVRVLMAWDCSRIWVNGELFFIVLACSFSTISIGPGNIICSCALMIG